MCDRNITTEEKHEKHFKEGLAKLINEYSMENESNTPDWILAEYLFKCLSCFAATTQQRETWYGRDARPTSRIEGDYSDSSPQDGEE